MKKRARIITDAGMIIVDAEGSNVEDVHKESNDWTYEGYKPPRWFTSLAQKTSEINISDPHFFTITRQLQSRREYQSGIFGILSHEDKYYWLSPQFSEHREHTRYAPINVLGELEKAQMNLEGLQDITRDLEVRVRSLEKKIEEKETSQQDLKRMIEESFSSQENVRFIALETIKHTNIVKVFTSEEKYDDRLMTELLMIERRILDAFPSQYLSFRFIPLAFQIRIEEQINTNADIVFER